MPLVTRWFTKLSLVHLVLGLCVQGLLAARGKIGLPEWVGAMNPVFFHLFMVGWVAQMIFGVAYWMFPRWTRRQPRGYEGAARAALVLLGAGLLLRAVGEPASVTRGGAVWGAAVVLSA